MSYHPPQKILEKYANVLVNFALGGGRGIKKHEVVRLITCECAKPLFVELRRAILKAGGHLISQYLPDNDPKFNIDKDFYIHARDHQLKFFPKKYFRGLIDQIDHSIYIESETDKQALKDIDPKKIMARGMAMKPFGDWKDEKENKGKFSWVIALYGTPAMAKEAGISEKEYWNQIIKACFLNKNNPIAKWKSIHKKIENYRKKLSELNIDKLHIRGADADLWVKIGEKRKWASGSGRNIPSFEIYTSPDWRGTEGWIKFNQPLYRYGKIIKGIELKFKNGRVIESKAKNNQKMLRQMIATKNADKIGEFSLTDRRFSHITKFMAETLFDENIGGKEGNMHIAIGKSFQNCYKGNPNKISKKGWVKLGFNDSSVHADIVSTTPRSVTAYLKNGSQKLIYKNGEFKI